MERERRSRAIRTSIDKNAPGIAAAMSNASANFVCTDSDYPSDPLGLINSTSTLKGCKADKE
jgi:hypothetical protein